MVSFWVTCGVVAYGSVVSGRTRMCGKTVVAAPLALATSTQAAKSPTSTSGNRSGAVAFDLTLSWSAVATRATSGPPRWTTPAPGAPGAASVAVDAAMTGVTTMKVAKVKMTTINKRRRSGIGAARCVEWVFLSLVIIT